jgi:hypothetical protein
MRIHPSLTKRRRRMESSSPSQSPTMLPEQETLSLLSSWSHRAPVEEGPPIQNIILRSTTIRTSYLFISKQTFCSRTCPPYIALRGNTAQSNYSEYLLCAALRFVFLDSIYIFLQVGIVDYSTENTVPCCLYYSGVLGLRRRAKECPYGCLKTVLGVILI